MLIYSAIQIFATKSAIFYRFLTFVHEAQSWFLTLLPMPLIYSQCPWFTQKTLACSHALRPTLYSKGPLLTMPILTRSLYSLQLLSDLHHSILESFRVKLFSSVSKTIQSGRHLNPPPTLVVELFAQLINNKDLLNEFGRTSSPKALHWKLWKRNYNKFDFL